MFNEKFKKQIGMDLLMTSYYFIKALWGIIQKESNYSVGPSELKSIDFWIWDWNQHTFIENTWNRKCHFQMLKKQNISPSVMVVHKSWWFS